MPSNYIAAQLTNCVADVDSYYTLMLDTAHATNGTSITR